jgi:hypothetical protein
MNAVNSSMEKVSLFGLTTCSVQMADQATVARKARLMTTGKRRRELSESLKSFMDVGCDVVEVRSECPTTTTAKNFCQ